MSREKLTAALLETSDTRARTIWQEVEQQANRYRQEADEHVAVQRQEVEGRHAAMVKQQQDHLDNRTGKRLRRIRLSAAERFSARLRQLALEQLSSMSAEARADSLQQLAAELPGLDWQQVTVHPDDQKQAAQLFSDCAIVTEPALLGGLIATTADGAICVNNSLSRRLEQAWPKLSGSLLDVLQTAEETDDVATSA